MLRSYFLIIFSEPAGLSVIPCLLPEFLTLLIVQNYRKHTMSGNFSCQTEEGEFPTWNLGGSEVQTIGLSWYHWL